VPENSRRKPPIAPGEARGDDRRLLLLALNRAEFLKPVEKWKLLSMTGESLELFRLDRTDLEHLLGRRVLTSTGWNVRELLSGAERDMRTLTRGAIGCTFNGDDDFPPMRGNDYDPPLVLFFRGTLPDQRHAVIGVVGTRQPTGAGRTAAYRLGLELAGAGAAVVSGLALGIDSEAHRGSVDGGGTAVGVLGNGLDSVHPASSAGLARDVLKGGGVLFSEYPPETPPRRHHFPARNRIISGLAQVVVVVQAPERSGALITADYALDQGKELVVHRAGLHCSRCRGTSGLAECGARVIDGAADVLGADPIGSDEPGASRFPRDAVSHQEPEPGRSLAELVAMELRGEASFHNGRFVRRRGDVPGRGGRAVGRRDGAVGRRDGAVGRRDGG